MCIVLLSSAHPEYPLILLNNRDEFLHRPTARAHFWPAPHAHIFSGRDLQRPEKGTWLGITKSGRIAVLTNFHEASSHAAIGQRSRGAMISEFVTSDLPTHQWLRDVDTTGVGGFSMICGSLGGGCGGEKKLGVVSNRTAWGDGGVEAGAEFLPLSKGQGCAKEAAVRWTHGLSNALFADPEPWPKITLGRTLLSSAIAISAATGEDEAALVERLFAVLSHDTMPSSNPTDAYDKELENLRESVFIPAFVTAAEKKEDARPKIAKVNGTTERRPSWAANGNGAANGKANGVNGTHVHAGEKNGTNGCGESEEQRRWRESPRLYGTQAQTVILVHRSGRVKYIERTLFDEAARPRKEAERDVVEEFVIEGW